MIHFRRSIAFAILCLGLPVAVRGQVIFDWPIRTAPQPEAVLTGAGSVFWVELPIVRDDPKEEATESLDEDLINQLSQTVSASGSGIAYIEDNPANLKFMKKVFEKEFACDLLTANDGVQGLEMVKQMRPALVLLDINLPGMNGLEILNNLKNDAQTRQIPIVMVSANAMSESISKAMEAGASGYLTKPIDVKKLKEMLNSLIHC